MKQNLFASVRIIPAILAAACSTGAGSDSETSSAARGEFPFAIEACKGSNPAPDDCEPAALISDRLVLVRRNLDAVGPTALTTATKSASPIGDLLATEIKVRLRTGVELSIHKVHVPVDGLLSQTALAGGDSAKASQNVANLAIVELERPVTAVTPIAPYLEGDMPEAFTAVRKSTLAGKVRSTTLNEFCFHPGFNADAPCLENIEAKPRVKAEIRFDSTACGSALFLAQDKTDQKLAAISSVQWKSTLKNARGECIGVTAQGLGLWADWLRFVAHDAAAAGNYEAPPWAGAPVATGGGDGGVTTVTDSSVSPSDASPSLPDSAVPATDASEPIDATAIADAAPDADDEEMPEGPVTVRADSGSTGDAGSVKKTNKATGSADEGGCNTSAPANASWFAAALGLVALARRVKRA